MSASVFHLELPRNEEGVENLDGSNRSSDGPSSIRSGYDSNFDERWQIERKANEIKEAITKKTLARASDVEDYLSFTKNVENTVENPQLIRVRQHFEKKNKKHAHEIEYLKKKLDTLQSKLADLELSTPLEHSARASVLTNIRRTTPLLRGVISAPSGIANTLKSEFGSVDCVVDNDFPYASQSTSYDYFDAKKVLTKGGKQLETVESDAVHSDSNSHFELASDTYVNAEQGLTISLSEYLELKQEMDQLNLQNRILQEQIESIESQMRTELQNYTSLLLEQRIRSQRMEQSLNDGTELHQAEMHVIKVDLNTIATRMDYQYCEKFRSIEELVELTQTKMTQIETAFKERSRRSAKSSFDEALLNGANILVEIFKLILFVISFFVDFIKLGTRTKTGFLCILSLSILSSQYIDYYTLFSKLFARIIFQASTVLQEQGRDDRDEMLMDKANIHDLL